LAEGSETSAKQFHIFYVDQTLMIGYVCKQPERADALIATSQDWLRAMFGPHKVMTAKGCDKGEQGQ
jgi:predicted signal transduction protein with EAL and GGDEF domain